MISGVSMCSAAGDNSSQTTTFYKPRSLSLTDHDQMENPFHSGRKFKTESIHTHTHTHTHTHIQLSITLFEKKTDGERDCEYI